MLARPRPPESCCCCCWHVTQIYLSYLSTSAKEKFEIEEWLEVYLVIEEDGTEVDDEEYFSTLSDNTVLMVLFKDDIWSPQGPAYT